MEFLSKSMEIGLGSSWSISQWNTQGIPFKINGNLYGEILMEFPSISMGICMERILMEFPSISMGICMEKILMEFHLKSMEIGLESS